MNCVGIIKPDQHFYSISELISSGLSYYKIKNLVVNGNLEKLNNKVYENMSFKGENTDIDYARVLVPKGVVCMMSAARHYGLTNYLPDGVDIAIERDMKISSLPDWPQINLWYFPENRFNSGISSSQDDACTFKIYDIEKTVVDVLYYRNRVGIEEMKEILKNYLMREDRNLIKLHRYAAALGCQKIFETYMEVLI